MGRPELPVDHTVPARGELAVALRELRAAARLTYDNLAASTGVSAATLKRASSGRSVPSWQTVQAIVDACGDPDGAVGHLWQRVRISERDRLKGCAGPVRSLVTTAGDFSEALEYFYERAGALPLRQLQALPGARTSCRQHDRADRAPTGAADQPPAVHSLPHGLRDRPSPATALGGRLRPDHRPAHHRPEAGR
ncbi:helix-turn-helix domain-containing protein [Streptomyces erythrochromogenes]|uniref:helix-turn-helix domain-containing protein n=1 Tax=Streptomyces erythrochromogenes TaxID=285574 RepID=UPI0036B865AE